MLKRALLTATFVAFAAGSALAGSCPVMVSAIDAALSAGPDLSDEQIAEVKALRDQGEAEHEAGKHDDSVATLQKAKEMLGLE